LKIAGPWNRAELQKQEGSSITLIPETPTHDQRMEKISWNPHSVEHPKDPPILW
jgi:hypothetical protein